MILLCIHHCFFVYVPVFVCACMCVCSADFGVARILNRKSVAKSFCGELINQQNITILRLSISDPISGTPPYMAPELFLSYLSKGVQGQSQPVG